MSLSEKIILGLALACFFLLPLAAVFSRTETDRRAEPERPDVERDQAPRRHPSTVDGRARIRRTTVRIPAARVSVENGGRK